MFVLIKLQPNAVESRIRLNTVDYVVIENPLKRDGHSSDVNYCQIYTVIVKDEITGRAFYTTFDAILVNLTKGGAFNENSSTNASLT